MSDLGMTHARPSDGGALEPSRKRHLAQTCAAPGPCVTECVSVRVQRVHVRGVWWYSCDSGASEEVMAHPGPQAEALKYKQDHNHQVLAKWGDYTFGSFPTQEAFADYIAQTPPPQRQFYEVLLADEPQRMFCEMDGYFTELPDGVSEAGVVADFYTLMERVFATLGLGPLRSEQHRWLTSSQGSKLSLHWVYLDGRVFRNCNDQNAFWAYVRHVAEQDFPNLLYVHQQKDQQGQANGVMEARCVIDGAVYTANRAMRTIHSSKKAGSDRLLRPFVWDAATKRLALQGEATSTEHFIHTPPNAACHFYELQYPKTAAPRRKQLKLEDVRQIVQRAVPNVDVVGVRGHLFQLRNVGTRTCILKGERNETDNSFVVWRSDGLYFGCHDAGCVGELKKIYSLETTKAVGPATDYHFGDAIELAQRRNLTKQDVEQFFHDCVVRVLHGGHPLVFVRNRAPNGESRWVLCGSHDPFEGSQNLLVQVVNPAFNPAQAEDAKQNPPFISTSFHQIWRQIHWDQNKIGLFANVDFHPYFKEPPELHSTFNLFRGFPHSAAESHMNPEVLQVILEHLKILCGGEEHVVDYVLKWQAHLIQKPFEKPGVALVFQSVQGAGKNLYWDFMKHVIGRQHWSMVARIETVLGRFNKHMEGKLLTVLNEISNYGGAHKSNDYLKSLITDETLTIEPKGKETYTIRDCSRFVFLTNNNWAVKVESRDRRYVVIEADQEHVGNHEYFTRLAAALEHPDAPTSMFSYLATLDLSQWNHRLLPQTQARDEVQLASVPTPIRYIISQLEHHKTMAYFEDYKQWCETHNERNEFNSRSFFHLLRNALGQEIKSRRIDTGVAKVMCLDNTEAALQALRAHLNQPNLVLSPVEENPDYDELKDYMME